MDYMNLYLVLTPSFLKEGQLILPQFCSSQMKQKSYKCKAPLKKIKIQILCAF